MLEIIEEYGRENERGIDGAIMDRISNISTCKRFLQLRK
jgi:hypothetical protein